MSNCKHCGLPLNQSQFKSKDNQDYKSCPYCSKIDGEEHIYYEYPDTFGTTDKRASSNYPDGPQSYCRFCRSDRMNPIRGKKCSEF